MRLFPSSPALRHLGVVLAIFSLSFSAAVTAADSLPVAVIVAGSADNRAEPGRLIEIRRIHDPRLIEVFLAELPSRAIAYADCASYWFASCKLILIDEAGEVRDAFNWEEIARPAPYLERIKVERRGDAYYRLKFTREEIRASIARECVDGRFLFPEFKVVFGLRHK